MKVLTFIGKVLIGTALLILILGVMVFALGAFFITRPILKNNPVMRKMHAMSYAMVSLFALVSAFQPEPLDDNESLHNGAGGNGSVRTGAQDSR